MIDEISHEDYGSFLNNLPPEKISVFNQVSWIDLYGDSLKVYGCFEKGNRCIAVFFVVSEIQSRVSMLKTPPYIPHCGLIHNNSASNAAKKMSNEKKVLAEIADFLSSRKEKITFLAFPPEFIDMQPFLWKKFKVTPQYTYQMSLGTSEADIEKRMSPERRNDVKRAIKEGISAERILDMVQVEKLIEKTFGRKKKDYDASFIHKILFDFSNEENSAAFLSSKDGVPMAASFFIHNGDKAYYLLGGYDHEKGHAAAGALALSTGIKWCRENGIKTFDFEGSMLPEVERYFRGFGPDLTSYYLVHKASKALEIALKFKKPELF